MNTNERFYPHARATGAGPEFGIDANSLKTKTFDLSVARDHQAYEIGGNVLWAIAASDPNAVMNVRMNDQLRDPLPVQAGLFIKGVRYSRIYVSNEVQAGQTITILYCVEEFNNISIENPAGATAAVSVVNDVDLSKAGHLESMDDVVVPTALPHMIMVLPVNVNRRSAIIGNLATNAEILRIADNNVTAGRGAEVGPGESFIVDTTDEIWAYNPGAADQNVTVAWTED